MNSSNVLHFFKNLNKPVAYSKKAPAATTQLQKSIHELLIQIHAFS